MKVVAVLLLGFALLACGVECRRRKNHRHGSRGRHHLEGVTEGRPSRWYGSTVTPDPDDGGDTSAEAGASDDGVDALDDGVDDSDDGSDDDDERSSAAATARRRPRWRELSDEPKRQRTAKNMAARSKAGEADADVDDPMKEDDAPHAGKAQRGNNRHKSSSKKMAMPSMKNDNGGGGERGDDDEDDDVEMSSANNPRLDDDNVTFGKNNDFKKDGRFSWFHSLSLGNLRPLGISSSFPFRFHISPLGQWYAGPNVCKRIVKKPSQGQDSNDEVYTELSKSEKAHILKCWESSDMRKCTYRTIGAGGHKYTNVEIIRCCVGYRVENNVCVKVGNVSEALMTLKNSGAAAFSNALEALVTQPAGWQLSNVTVFAPVDSAVDAYLSSEEYNTTFVVVGPRQTQKAKDTREMLLSHVVDGIVSTEELLNNQLLETMNANVSIRINIYEHPHLVTANCAPLSRADFAIANGSLNVVDRLLVPVKDSISSRLEGDVRLTGFAAALRMAFGNQLAELVDAQHVTVFAPNNEAMAEVNAVANQSTGSTCLRKLLKQHFVSNVVCTSAVGHAVRVSTSSGKEITMHRERDGTVMVDKQARIVDGDIMATNGVVHVVDKVLLDKDNGMDLEQRMHSEQLVHFANLMNKVRLSPKEISDVTLLVPPDAALEKFAEQNSNLHSSYDEAALVNYHVVRGMVSCDKFRGQVHTTHGVPLTLQTYALFPFLGNVHTANCVKVIKENIQGCNGIIHVLEKVLEPPSKTTLQVLQSTAGLESFAELLQQTSYGQKLDTNGDQTYTVYAPNNDAMRKVMHLQSMTKSQKEQLASSHVVLGYKCCAGVPVHFSSFTETAAGNQIWLSRQTSSGDIWIRGGGKVLKCDVLSTNGVVHIVDKVLDDRPMHTFGFSSLVMPVSLMSPRAGLQPPK